MRPCQFHFGIEWFDTMSEKQPISPQVHYVPLTLSSSCFRQIQLYGLSTRHCARREQVQQTHQYETRHNFAPHYHPSITLLYTILTPLFTNPQFTSLIWFQYIPHQMETAAVPAHPLPHHSIGTLREHRIEYDKTHIIHHRRTMVSYRANLTIITPDRSQHHFQWYRL